MRKSKIKSPADYKKTTKKQNKKRSFQARVAMNDDDRPSRNERVCSGLELSKFM